MFFANDCGIILAILRNLKFAARQDRATSPSSPPAPISSLPDLASVSQKEETNRETELKSLTNAACPYPA
jgi:hypothetical protein